MVNRRILGFPSPGSAGKESACNAGHLGSIPVLGRSLGKGKGSPLQYSGLGNSMGSIVLGHKESDTTEHLSLSRPMAVCLGLNRNHFQLTETFLCEDSIFLLLFSGLCWFSYRIFYLLPIYVYYMAN